ncbi:MAG: hypothetical protein ABR498_08780 [Candidatus Dormibacteria bacterium]
MSAPALAAVWAGTGLVAAGVLPLLRLRALGFLVPLAGLVAALLVTLGGTEVPGAGLAGDLAIDRVAQGLLVVGAAGIAWVLLLQPVLEAAQLRTVGLVAAGVVVALSTGNALVWAVALFGAMSVLALRWIATAPGRASFASGRVALPGGATLIAAAPFLPIALIAGPRPIASAALLGCGIAAVVGLLPLGGWAAAVVTTQAAADVAAWCLLLGPGVLLTADRLQATMPPLALVYFEGILTVLGLTTAAWQALQALRLRGRARYARVLLADLALVAAAVGTGRAAQALPALLLIVVTHVITAPVLLQAADVSPRAARLIWLLLCGLPPGPSFWGRLLVVEALTQSTFWGVVVALGVMAALFAASVLSALRITHSPQSAAPGGRVRSAVVESGAWSLLAGGLAAGVAPGAAVAFLFGLH